MNNKEDKISVSLASRLSSTVSEALNAQCDINKSLDEIGDSLTSDQRTFKTLYKIGYCHIEKVRCLQMLFNSERLSFEEIKRQNEILIDDCQMQFSDKKPKRNSSRWACYALCNYPIPTANVPSEWLMEHARFLYESLLSKDSIVSKNTRMRQAAISRFYVNMIWPKVHSPGVRFDPLGDFWMESNIQNVIKYLAEKGDTTAKSLAAIIVPSFYASTTTRIKAITGGKAYFMKSGEFRHSGIMAFRNEIICAEIKLDNNSDIDSAFQALRLYLDSKMNNSQDVKILDGTYSDEAFWVHRALYLLLVMQYHYGKVIDAAKDAWKYRKFRHICPKAYERLMNEAKEFNFLKKLF